MIRVLCSWDNLALVLTPFRLFAHAIPPPTGGIHSIDFVEIDDHIHMLSWDDQGPESIVFDDGYGDDRVHEVFSS